MGYRTDLRCRREGRARAGAPLLVCLMLLGWFASPLRATDADKKAKPFKALGLVTAVERNQVSLHTTEGTELAVATREDFRERVAIGSQVTAWYWEKDGKNVLEWLEYPLENLFAPPQEFSQQIKKIIILPRSAFPDSGGLLDTIGSFLEQNLGWYVAPRMLAEEIDRRSKTSQSTLVALDPTTGEFNLDRYLETHHNLIRKLASETRVSAVLETDVEAVQAKVYSQVAVWDGAEQPITTSGRRIFSRLFALPQDGEVPAASVVLKLWSSQGKLLWSNRRGFAILAIQVGVGGKFRDRPVSEVLQDTPSVTRWLKTAFESLLPADTSRTAEAKH